jgi:hypothetical protein
MKSEKSQKEITLSVSSFFKSPEILALLVFAGIYIFFRLVETYILPFIPSFFTTEISSLFRWGPILIPIIFGITYFSKENKNIDEDTILKERMMLWTKI